MSGERWNMARPVMPPNVVESAGAEPAADPRLDPSKTQPFRVGVLAISLGAVVGIVVELAVPGQGPRVGLSLAGVVGAAFAFAWAVRALGGGR